MWSSLYNTSTLSVVVIIFLIFLFLCVIFPLFQLHSEWGGYNLLHPDLLVILCDLPFISATLWVWWLKSSWSFCFCVWSFFYYSSTLSMVIRITIPLLSLVVIILLILIFLLLCLIFFLLQLPSECGGYNLLHPDLPVTLCDLSFITTPLRVWWL